LHRNHPVMKLSQGTFLSMLLVAAILATISTNFLNPKNAIYCNLGLPLVLVPTAFVYAIMIARTWRTQKLLSPLLQDVYAARMPSIFSRWIRWVTILSLRVGQQTNPRLKNTVTDAQLIAVVGMFCLPQVLLMALAGFFQPKQLDVWFNDNESLGQAVCTANISNAKTLTTWGFWYILVLNVVVLVVAHSGRRLPSLFNELHDILGMSAFNVAIMVLGYAIVAVTNNPTTSPSVSFFVWTASILSITLNSSVRLLLPKLQMCTIIGPDPATARSG